MTKPELQVVLDRAVRRVATWPEWKKIAMRVGKYADPKEELKAVTARRRSDATRNQE